MTIPMPEDYRPYHTMPAFDDGVRAYEQSIYRNPFDGDKSAMGQVSAQAWDRGLEYASRCARYYRR